MAGMHPNLEGLVVKDRYRLVRLIGRGAMGEVWLATDDNLSGREVAVKVISVRGGNGNAEGMRRFMRELDAMSRVKSAHVVQVTDSGVLRIQVGGGIWAVREETLPFLVMEYVRGATLKDVAGRYGRFTVGQAARVLGDVLEGLSAMHRVGVIHRDVKPANIMYDEDFRGYRLMDFGLAKPAQPRAKGTLTQAGWLMGTGDYMPPEAVSQKSGPPGDLYSTGVMCWELVAGWNPIARPAGETDVSFALRRREARMPLLSAECAGAPRAFSDFLARLTAFDPARRPQDATAALAEFDRMADALTAQEMKWRAKEGGRA